MNPFWTYTRLVGDIRNIVWELLGAEHRLFGGAQNGFKRIPMRTGLLVFVDHHHWLVRFEFHEFIRRDTIAFSMETTQVHLILVRG